MRRLLFYVLYNDDLDQHFDLIVEKLIETLERMHEIDCPLLVRKHKAFSGSIDEQFRKKLMEVFCSALTSDFKAKFDGFLEEKHVEFIKCFPMLDPQLEKLCQTLNTLDIDRYSLESIASKLLDKWIGVQ
jgi:hypothetical protein